MNITEKIIQITAGRGPAECCWVVAQVLKMLLDDAKTFNVSATVLHREQGPENRTLYSATIQLAGIKTNEFIKQWEGTVQWIGQSQYRTMCKRKNWFVGINVIDTAELNVKINEADIQYQATRASGPGGQHVNKVSTAIRATHLPTGLSVLASDSRSQSHNKKCAHERLINLLKVKNLETVKEKARSTWDNHNQLERGNPVKVFRGTDFKPKPEKKTFKSTRKSSKQEFKRNYEDY